MVLGVAGVTAGNNLLFLLLGATLGTIVLSGILSELAITPVRVSMRAAGPLRAGETGRLLIRFSRTENRPGKSLLYGLVLHERTQGLMQLVFRRAEPGLIECRLPVLSGASSTQFADRHMERRGRLKLHRTELSTTFPFGLLHKEKDVDVEGEVWVGPRRVPLPRALELGSHSPTGEDARPVAGDGVEFHGVRERREDESARRLHALRTAALGRDILIETAHETRPTAWIGVVHSSEAEAEALERAVEYAAAWLEDRASRGMEVGLVTGTEAVEGLGPALARLARLERTKGPLPRRDALWLVPAGAPRPALGRSLRIASDGALRGEA